MASKHHFHPFSLAGLSAVALAAILGLVHGVARADGPPLVLSTQTGIHDGQKGIVLQNAPFERRPMVNAQKAAAPAELAPDSPPLNIIVEPQVGMDGGVAQSGQAVRSVRSAATRSSRPVARSTSRAGTGQ